MRKSGLLYFLLLLLCWTALVGVGTCVFVETTVRQYLSQGFSATQGKIVQSIVGHGNIIQRGVEIEYNYTVNGAHYTGNRVRYDDHNITIDGDKTIAEYPHWSIQTVYYNPRHPADSLLEPGVDGGNWLLLLFALPLNVLTWTLWAGFIAKWREKSDVGPAGGVHILKRPGLTRVSLGETSALAAGFYAMAIAAFFAAFPTVIIGSFAPSIEEMNIVWILVLGAGLSVFAWRLTRKQSGCYDLRIDQASQTVTLPQTAGRRQPLAISRSEISGVSMQRRIRKSPGGTHFSYLPALNRNGSSAEYRSMKLVSWGWSEERARAFSQWLSQELGVEFKGIEDETSKILGAPFNLPVAG